MCKTKPQEIKAIFEATGTAPMLSPAERDFAYNRDQLSLLTDVQNVLIALIICLREVDKSGDALTRVFNVAQMCMRYLAKAASEDQARGMLTQLERIVDAEQKRQSLADMEKRLREFDPVTGFVDQDD